MVSVLIWTAPELRGASGQPGHHRRSGPPLPLPQESPPSSGIAADRSYGTLCDPTELGERPLFKVGCTIPGDDLI